ncbi:methyltransferase domain-containing protein [Enhygromyxa salina]|uniref:methyltransferase domain-containing protein n=1 Tax=Enhygromyxa salina TaxID=215803 RepID=UPI0015E68B72|nr:methyltransferase domain-containing protein [Enhygromyxa salina]
MFHLPAYLALERWVLARTVVVIQPSGPEGPRRLLSAGARRVLVIGGDFPSEAGMEVRPSSGSRLPLRDESIDIVMCIEAFGRLRSTDRRELLRESHRILRDEGMFCAWIEQREAEAFGRTLAGSSQVDFWALEDQINAVFARVDMLAQMPWQGFSVAPILDERDERHERDPQEPQLALREDLLVEAPEASHFLAIASKSRTPAGLSRECLLIPLPRDEVFGGPDPRASRDGAEIEELRDELDRLREELSLRAAKVAAAHGRVRELESQLEALRARTSEVEAAEIDRLRDGLTEAETQLSIFRAREQEQGLQIARLEDERSDLLSNLDAARSEQSTVGANVANTQAELRRELDAVRARAREAEDSLRAADERLRSQATDLQILSRTGGEQDKAVERLTTQLDSERQALEQVRFEAQRQRERLESLDAEREELRRQNEVYVAEREGARKLAQRMEAELEVAGRRAKEQDLALAAKIEEASRLAGEFEAARRRLAEADKALAQTRTRAEELTATAAQGAEQGRMLADVAVDRDRIRDELSQRNRQFEELESRLWETREALQKERLEGVRVSGEVERLREQVERSRAEEQKRTREVEELGRELRQLEVGKAELAALLRARDEQLARLQQETTALAGQSADVDELRTQLRARNDKLANLTEQLAAVEARDERASAESRQTKQALDQASERVTKLQAELEQERASAAMVQGELDVKLVEIQQLGGTVQDLQTQLEESRELTKQREGEKAELQRQLEEAAAIRDSLRRQLRERELENDRLSTGQDSHSLELSQLRRELEAATEAADQIEQIERGEADGPSADELATWPDAARRELGRLRSELAARTRDHARELTTARADGAAAAAGPGVDGDRVRRLRLEVQVRTAEQEYMLASLDSAEQKIWEMTDASDRNAARFAASLAQLEKHKETVDSLLDELEVTRNLLAAEQARALEQERMLASERAKLARAGIGAEGFPASAASEDDPFANFDGEDLLDLGKIDDEPPGMPNTSGKSGKPASVLSGKSPARRAGSGTAGQQRPTAQELDHALASLTDDDEDDGDRRHKRRAQAVEPDAPTARTRARSSSRARAAAPSQKPPERAPNRARLTVEAVDDDEWED